MDEREISDDLLDLTHILAAVFTAPGQKIYSVKLARGEFRASSCRFPRL